MPVLRDPEALEKYYEEQLDSQRGMLTSAINTLVKKTEQLEIALKQVEKRNFELNQISDRTFHDMREPMVALLGLVQMLRAETESESADYLLNLAEASVKRLDNFSLALADYVRAVQKEFKYQQIGTKPFFEELEASLSSIEGRDRVNINFCNQSIEEHPTINYDPEKLNIILKNLIVNSIKFRDIDEKEPRIDIAYKVNGSRTILLVKDNGMGISKTVFNKVTNMFYRGTGKSNGSGLGLYIVKTLLDESGDQLRIRSQEGVGTSVFIILENKD